MRKEFSSSGFSSSDFKRTETSLSPGSFRVLLLFRESAISFSAVDFPHKTRVEDELESIAAHQQQQKQTILSKSSTVFFSVTKQGVLINHWNLKEERKRVCMGKWACAERESESGWSFVEWEIAMSPSRTCKWKNRDKLNLVVVVRGNDNFIPSCLTHLFPFRPVQIFLTSQRWWTEMGRDFRSAPHEEMGMGLHFLNPSHPVPY